MRPSSGVTCSPQWAGHCNRRGWTSWWHLISVLRAEKRLSKIQTGLVCSESSNRREVVWHRPPAHGIHARRRPDAVALRRRTRRARRPPCRPRRAPLPRGSSCGLLSEGFNQLRRAMTRRPPFLARPKPGNGRRAGRRLGARAEEVLMGAAARRGKCATHVGTEALANSGRPGPA
jgi:hypothetical protein